MRAGGRGVLDEVITLGARGQDRETARGQSDGWLGRIVQSLKVDEHAVDTRRAGARPVALALREATR